MVAQRIRFVCARNVYDPAGYNRRDFQPRRTGSQCFRCWSRSTGSSKGFAIQCRVLLPRFLRAVHNLREAKLSQLVQLGDTLYARSEEIVAMWRFTPNNGITEGFHIKMETISRQAFSLRNFENCRLRVKVLCG